MDKLVAGLHFCMVSRKTSQHATAKCWSVKHLCLDNPQAPTGWRFQPLWNRLVNQATSMKPSQILGKYSKQMFKNHQDENVGDPTGMLSFAETRTSCIESLEPTTISTCVSKRGGLFEMKKHGKIMNDHRQGSIWCQNQLILTGHQVIFFVTNAFFQLDLKHHCSGSCSFHTGDHTTPLGGPPQALSHAFAEVQRCGPPPNHQLPSGNSSLENPSIFVGFPGF